MSARDESRTTIPRPVIEAIGELMGTLADPTRLSLLDLLRGGEMHGLRMAEELGVPHKNVSHHLAILTGAGVLARRREGRHVLYSIEDWTALWLVDQAARAISDPDA